MNNEDTFSTATFGSGDVRVDAIVVWFDEKYPKLRIPDPRVRISTKSSIIVSDSTEADEAVACKTAPINQDAMSIQSACKMASIILHANNQVSRERATNLINAIAWANKEQRLVFEMERTRDLEETR